MTMTDAQVATTLDNTLAVAGPILDVLAGSDPLQLKPRTFGRRWYDVIPTRFGDLTATALNLADWPGTEGWAALSMNERADWWVHRIGSLTSIAAAFPGVFGAWTKKLPVGTYLGAASQSLIALAVAREYGVDDRRDQIALLGSVLFDREVDAGDLTPAPATPLSGSTDLVKAAVKGLWEIGWGLQKLAKALGARPQMPRLLSHLGWLPLIGGPATYVGERIALRRAVGSTRRWIVDHPDTVTP